MITAISLGKEMKICCWYCAAVVGGLLLASACIAADEEAAAVDKSRFLVDVRQVLEQTKKNYKDAKAPALAPMFRWDFSNKTVHEYSYQQETFAEHDFGMGGRERTGQKMSAAGKLRMKGQGDGTADFVMMDMKATMEMGFDEDGNHEITEQSIPAVVMQGMKEDGSGALGNPQQDMLLRLLFPLPPKPLKVGGAGDIPVTMPFNAMGSLLQVKGRSRVTLARYVKIGTRTCAQFNVDIDISELKVPEELEGEYKCFNKGAAVLFFDVKEKRFVSGIIANLMKTGIDAPMPNMAFGGDEDVD
ncbi:MAG: hypothetical protein HQ559_08380, partial [Lentisphaerae bacterium]|nr:hypothetical protein [Lentisphaerota bacterium]